MKTTKDIYVSGKRTFAALVAVPMLLYGMDIIAGEKTAESDSAAAQVPCFADAGKPDPRTRTIVNPVRVVSAGNGSPEYNATVANRAQVLVSPKHGQVPEGPFLAGGGIVLSKGQWLILDFGCEIAGSIQIGSGSKSDKNGNSRVRVRLGESVSETLSELEGKNPTATATNDHAIRDDVISLPWLGRREFGESGFRFVRIDNVGQSPVHLEYVRAISLMRPMERLGSFKCSDSRINDIWETAVRTIHLCCQDYIWDGIKRDRLVWMGDTHPETMAVLNVFGAQKIIPETLAYSAATTDPAKAWMNNMPTYTLWWLRNAAAWYRYTGDARFLAKYRDYIAKTAVRVLSSIDKSGRWKEDSFLDWPTRFNKPAERAGAQGLLKLALEDTAFLLYEAGSDELAKKCADAVRRVAPLDAHGVKSASALLALSRLADPRKMFADSLGKRGHEGVSTFYGYYMLEAMSDAGKTAHALSTVRDYWGGMLDMGATSFWEDFNLAWTNNAFRIDEMPVKGKRDIHGGFGAHCYKGFRHSLCHGWSAGPAPFLINRVLGIRPVGTGCKEVEVKPDLGDLEWAEGAMALPGGGCVKVRAWRKADGTTDFTVTAPPGVTVSRK